VPEKPVDVGAVPTSVAEAVVAARVVGFGIAGGGWRAGCFFFALSRSHGGKRVMLEVGGDV